MLEKTGISVDPAAQMDREGWPKQRELFTALFKTKTRDEWNEILEGSDACYAPVLTMTEAAQDAHIKARGTVVDFEGILQPAPAPRFSRTKPEIQRSAAKPGEHTDEVLTEWGFSKDELEKLRDTSAIA